MDIIKNLEIYFQKLINENEEYKKLIEELEKTQKECSDLYIVSLSNIQKLEQEKNILKNQIKELEDDINDLTKVSRIIAFENENNSLKLEIRSLKNRIELFKNKKELKDKNIQTEYINIENKEIQTNYINTDNINNEYSENDLSHLIDYNIKNIKGIDYYVSKIEPKHVYEKTENGLGILRGTLNKINGKTKISWI